MVGSARSFRDIFTGRVTKKKPETVNYEYSLMMSFKLMDVPMINPAKPMRQITIFLKIMSALAKPVLLFQFAHVFSNAGNAIPRVDRASAPISEMNISKFGISTAITTV